MEPSDIVQSFEKFFLDVVGTIIPGGLLLLVFGDTIGKVFFPDFNSEILSFFTIIPSWLTLIVLSFIFGHVISSIGDKCIIPLIERLFHCFHSGKFESKRKKMEDKINSGVLFTSMDKEMKKLYPDVLFQGHDLRNLAMSIAPEGNQTIYRFMFLGILNKGVFSVSFISILITIFFYFLNLSQPLKVDSIFFHLKIIPFLICVMLTTLERYYYFDKVAYQTPFSQALANIIKLTKLK